MSFNDFKKSYFGDDSRQNRLNTYSRLGYLPRTEIDDTNYTLLTEDVLVAYTALSASRTITLPSAATLVATGPNNKVNSFIVKDETGSASTYNIVLQPTGGELFDGAANYTISSDFGSVQFYTEGTAFFIV